MFVLQFIFEKRSQIGLQYAKRIVAVIIFKLFDEDMILQAVMSRIVGKISCRELSASHRTLRTSIMSTTVVSYCIREINSANCGSSWNVYSMKIKARMKAQVYSDQRRVIDLQQGTN